MLQLSAITSLAITLVLIHGLGALNVTSPSAGSVWNLNDTNTVAWTAVSTDPTSFNILLVNQDPSCAPTGSSQVVKENVSAADGRYQISPIQGGIKDCGGYQINLVSPGNNGILAQSAPFHISSNSSASAGNHIQPGMQPGTSGTNMTMPTSNYSHGGAGVANGTTNTQNITSSVNGHDVSSPSRAPNGTASQSAAPMLALPVYSLAASALVSATLFALISA